MEKVIPTLDLPQVSGGILTGSTHQPSVVASGFSLTGLRSVYDLTIRQMRGEGQER
jgi:hypothetical protein